jgi:hypothetical protein
VGIFPLFSSSSLETSLALWVDGFGLHDEYSFIGGRTCNAHCSLVLSLDRDGCEEVIWVGFWRALSGLCADLKLDCARFEGALSCASGWLGIRVMV